MMDRKQLAQALEEIGTLLELRGENPFKIQAYRKAARTVSSLSEDVGALIESDRLTSVRGIGKALAEKIAALHQTGSLPYLEELRASVPPGLLDMLRIPGLGPKKVLALNKALGIASVGELEYACLENRLVELPGFGERSQQKILEGIERVKRYAGNFRYADVEARALEVVESLERSGLAQQVSVAGSLRRKKETVKDMDILASSKKPAALMKAFVGLPGVESVVAEGETKSSVVFDEGVAADLRVVTDKQFPYALHHFTGSREHNTAMRGRAKQKGMKMNEYGLFKGEKIIPCADEEQIFARLGLAYIPPELREDMGEIEAAEQGELPDLIEPSDIRGVLHVHTRASDGSNSLEELVEAMRAKGYAYLGIADHSQTAVYAGGLTPDQILGQHEAIDRINESLENFRVLKGIESDILADGSLDYDEKTLSRFDFVIASVHSNFNMTREEMTRRILRAMDNPHTSILGHVTGRLLLAREAYPLDMEAVLDKAAELGVIMELNANPYRLDLDWRMCKPAKQRGIRIAVNPDAHSIDGLDDVRYGVGIARKGWLSASDVINTYETDRIIQILGARRTR